MSSGRAHYKVCCLEHAVSVRSKVSYLFPPTARAMTAYAHGHLSRHMTPSVTGMPRPPTRKSDALTIHREHTREHEYPQVMLLPATSIGE